jgi:hypothetical protein
MIPILRARYQLIVVATMSLLTACADRPADPLAPPALAPTAAVMLGTWSYASPPRAAGDTPSLDAGLRVTLILDTALDSTFSGAVGAWFAGDVGLPPGTFGPVHGAVEPSGLVRLVIPLQRTGVPPITLVGRLLADTLTVAASHQGLEPGPFGAGAVFARRQVPVNVASTP